MFDCMDKPIIERKASVKPMPIFRYCTTPNHYDIPFPDWSFWGCIFAKRFRLLIIDDCSKRLKVN
ncbi:putative glycosyl transferase CAP10 domain-containing protein [Helianthus annuus]|nr:putative glycosyl transferase CAP10 domain-containing protein [Helianthus annuus]KAJ0577677.1 putative glycosyl transferase CAP10 domain-containing protein [Helianthus annuus]KAJ0585083.1 putative glycosyl transferase CAP10 domain-containing protein [Helianthus annuus]KAJ0919543.1 putative glycosyl transferase CAP10 domain-containing protein [Helianthus annuus]